MVASTDASALVPTSIVTDSMSILEQVKIVYAPNYFVPSNFEALMTIAKFSNENDKIFGFNVSSPQFIIDFKSQNENLYPYCNIISCNSVELE